MRTRHALAVTVVGLALAIPAFAETHTYFGFTVGVASAPPPPVLVYQSPPPVVLVPNSQVYVVSGPYGDDEFRYGGYYYVSSNGYWYRSHGYRGPFAVVDVRSVPRPIFDVPPGRWKHHWKHAGWDRYEVVAQNGGHGNGHGNGKGHGHGHGNDHD
jgi:hypothetical protein